MTTSSAALRLYEYPWETWTSLQQAWEVAEHYKQTNINKLRVYAALLIDPRASDMDRGHLALGGRPAIGHLNINARGYPSDLLTQIWGNYGWSTWCHLIEAAIKEAIASNSRGPIAEMVEQKSIAWLILELEIPLNKLPYLFKMGHITTGIERNGINSIRLHGDVPGAWISSVHMVIQRTMTHHAWANIKIGARYQRIESSSRSCGREEPTWNDYCAQCWVTHISHAQ